jgi:TetR/AcrR family transcriptional regulator
VRSTTELRDEILAAARTEFAQHGLAGARIDRIARAARASKERLYAHFKDKETLFRALAAQDSSEFHQAVPIRSDAVAEFAGDVYDLAVKWPEHVRMMTWARLEGITLDDPRRDGGQPVMKSLDAIETAQANRLIDACWQPFDLFTLLFGIGLAWAHSPALEAVNDDPLVHAQRRAAAVEAARRVVAAAP